MPKITKEAKSKKDEISKIANSTKTPSKVKSKLPSKSATNKTTTQKGNINEATSKSTTKNVKSRSSIKVKNINKKVTTKTIKKEVAKDSKISKVHATRLPRKVKTAFPENFSAMEYYDLPIKYSKTTVKLLAQTPNTLFVYWDISDDDRKMYINHYGEHFFEVTKPVLIVHNDSINYSFEIDINDFANCWYLNVNDSKCKYRIELGRRPIYNDYTNSISTTHIDTDYIYISSSNEIEAPNDHILFNPEQKMVYFKDVKTNEMSSKTINLSYMRNMGKVYNIYDMYKQIYNNEFIEEFDLSNPSSSNPTSIFK